MERDIREVEVSDSEDDLASCDTLFRPPRDQEGGNEHDDEEEDDARTLEWDAAAAAERAHKLCPDWAKPLFRLTQARLAQGQWAAAAEAARRGADVASPSEVPTFSALLNEVAVTACAAGSLAGFVGDRLEVRSAGDEAWLGGQAPHDPDLDGPETSEPGEVVRYLPALDGPPALPAPGGLDPGTALEPAAQGAAAEAAAARRGDLATWTAPIGRRRTSFRSLREAVAAASDGDIVMLCRGTHNGMGEVVVVDKRILIQGQGQLGDTVFDQRANSPTLRINRGGVVLHNLVVDHTGFKEALSFERTGTTTGSAAVGPLIVGCTLKCSGDDAVNVRGGAAPTFMDSTLTARKNGARVLGSGAPRFVRCTFQSCGEAGLKIMDAGHAELSSCTIVACEEEGVVVMDEGRLTCRDTTISGCKGPGVDISGRGTAILKRGGVCDCVGGVWIWDEGRAELAELVLEGGPSHALVLDNNHTHVIAQGCVITGTLHGRSEVLREVATGNVVRPPGRHTGWPLEDGPFQFVPNRFTRKQ